MLTVQNLPLDKIARKRVLVLVDPNIDKAAPTIATLQGKGARVTVATHLPANIRAVPEKLSSEFVKHLSDRVGRRVTKANDVIGAEASRVVFDTPQEQLVLLANLCLYQEDSINDIAFARQLASSFDVFVNDAFEVVHRALASNTGICRYVPIAVAGPWLADRVRELKTFLANPTRPFLAIVGGSDIARKLQLIDALLPHLDRLFVGGSLAFSFLRAVGQETGKAPVEPGFKPFIDDFLRQARKHTEIVFPEDFLIRDACSVRCVTALRESDRPVDIGTHSLSQLSNLMAGAYSILWVDSLGADGHQGGTQSDWEVVQQLYAAIPRRWQHAILAGCELVESLSKSTDASQFSHLPLLGDAAVHLVADRPMPALEALHIDAVHIARKVRKRVLVPVDGSDHAIAAARLLSRHVDAEHAEIHLLYAHTGESGSEVWRDPNDAARLDAEARMAGIGFFAAIERELAHYGLASHHQVVRLGTPAEEILKYSNEIKAELIIMGSHGRSKVLRLMLGSVSRKVVDNSRCPVLIARVQAFHEKM